MNFLGSVVHPRVGQLDASLLDSELFEQLKEKLAAVFKVWHPLWKDRYESELAVALRLILFKQTIWNHSTTYGGRLLSLKLVDARSGRDLGAKKKLIYGMLTIIGSYLGMQLDQYLALVSRDDLVSSNQSSVSRDHVIRALRSAADSAKLIWSAASLLNFVTFLYAGNYSTLIMRLLGMRWTPAKRATVRNVNYEFQNRQLVWNAMTEFLLFALPMMNFGKLQRLIFGRKNDSTSLRHDLPPEVCAVCVQKETAYQLVTNPYEAGCGHAYCYVCLSLQLAKDPEWPCMRCGQTLRPSALKPL